jgi:hypothetical protein
LEHFVPSAQHCIFVPLAIGSAALVLLARPRISRLVAAVLEDSRNCVRVEIVYAFYNDTFDQLRRVPLRTKLDRVQRFKLLGRSYIEVSICYASLYFAVPWCHFNTAPSTGFEAAYFSWITITTTGYGDILPQGSFTRLLCMTEIGIGLMLLVFAVGTYFSFEDKRISTD